MTTTSQAVTRVDLAAVAAALGLDGMQDVDSIHIYRDRVEIVLDAWTDKGYPVVASARQPNLPSGTAKYQVTLPVSGSKRAAAEAALKALRDAEFLHG